MRNENVRVHNLHSTTVKNMARLCLEAIGEILWHYCIVGRFVSTPVLSEIKQTVSVGA